MVSLIDPTKPVDDVPAVKSDLRANLLAAKNEIEALQNSGALLPAPVGAANGTLLQVIDSAYELTEPPGSFLFEIAPLDVTVGGTGQTSLAAVRSALADGSDAIGELVQIVSVGGLPGLPPLNGSQLTGLPGGGGGGGLTLVTDSTTAVSIGTTTTGTRRRLTSASAIAVTLTATAAIGNEVEIIKAGSGVVTVTPAAGAGYYVDGDDQTVAAATAAFTVPGAQWFQCVSNSGGSAARFITRGRDTLPDVLDSQLLAQGNVIGGNRAPTTAASMVLANSDSGKIITTTGNVTIPTAAGFNVTLVIGGAHTLGNGTVTSSAFASGDVVSVFNDNGGAPHAVRVLAASKVAFS
jgi:hypothetical protein